MKVIFSIYVGLLFLFFTSCVEVGPSSIGPSPFNPVLESRIDTSATFFEWGLDQFGVIELSAVLYVEVPFVDSIATKATVRYGLANQLGKKMDYVYETTVFLVRGTTHEFEFGPFKLDESTYPVLPLGQKIYWLFELLLPDNSAYRLPDNLNNTAYFEINAKKTSAFDVALDWKSLDPCLVPEVCKDVLARSTITGAAFYLPDYINSFLFDELGLTFTRQIVTTDTLESQGLIFESVMLVPENTVQAPFREKLVGFLLRIKDDEYNPEIIRNRAVQYAFSMIWDADCKPADRFDLSFDEQTVRDYFVRWRQEVVGINEDNFGSFVYGQVEDHLNNEICTTDLRINPSSGHPGPTFFDPLGLIPADQYNRSLDGNKWGALSFKWGGASADTTTEDLIAPLDEVFGTENHPISSAAVTAFLQESTSKTIRKVWKRKQKIFGSYQEQAVKK
jgi:hypothetical protein